MCSDESHFNVSVGSDGQGHKTVSTNHNLFEERRAEAVLNRGSSTYQPNALPLGQTSKLFDSVKVNSGIKLLGSMSIFKLSKSYKTDRNNMMSDYLMRLQKLF